MRVQVSQCVNAGAHCAKPAQRRGHRTAKPAHTRHATRDAVRATTAQAVTNSAHSKRVPQRALNNTPETRAAMSMRCLLRHAHCVRAVAPPHLEGSVHRRGTAGYLLEQQVARRRNQTRTCPAPVHVGRERAPTPLIPPGPRPRRCASRNGFSTDESADRLKCPPRDFIAAAVTCSLIWVT
eukprot:2694309-Rhodomonas_salina.8